MEKNVRLFGHSFPAIPGPIRFGLILLGSALAGTIAAHADEPKAPAHAPAPAPEASPRVVYPKETKLDFEGAQIEGELRNPGEFYFQHRNEENFDSLVKRRKNFHQQMLRDVVVSK